MPSGDTLPPSFPPTEYMYQMMKFNKFSLPGEVGWGEEQRQGPRPRPAPAPPRLEPSVWLLPPQAFYIIRYHSFYPWHTGGDYRQLCNEQDLAMLPWVQEFKYGRALGGLGAGRGGALGAASRSAVPPAAASSISTPRAPTCRTWTSCGPTTRGSLTSTAPVSCAGDRPVHLPKPGWVPRVTVAVRHRDDPPRPFQGSPQAHLHSLPGWPPSPGAIKALKQLVSPTLIEAEAPCGGALTGGGVLPLGLAVPLFLLP